MAKEALQMADQKSGSKEYTKPHLIEYGKVEEITKGATGSTFDSPFTHPTK
jgi:hypothetical protein